MKEFLTRWPLPDTEDWPQARIYTENGWVMLHVDGQRPERRCLDNPGAFELTVACHLTPIRELAINENIRRRSK